MFDGTFYFLLGLFFVALEACLLVANIKGLDLQVYRKSQSHGINAWYKGFNAIDKFYETSSICIAFLCTACFTIGTILQSGISALI